MPRLGFSRLHSRARARGRTCFAVLVCALVPIACGEDETVNPPDEASPCEVQSGQVVYVAEGASPLGTVEVVNDLGEHAGYIVPLWGFVTDLDLPWSYPPGWAKSIAESSDIDEPCEWVDHANTMSSLVDRAAG